MAITKNGAGRGWLTPSTLTAPDAIASSRALWVRGLARLISSASSTWANRGPGRKRKLPEAGSSTLTPIRSPGSRSLVNDCRRKPSPWLRASASARVVLPVPGRSSISRCPRASRQATARLTCRSLPTSTCDSRRSSVGRSAAGSATIQRSCRSSRRWASCRSASRTASRSMPAARPGSGSAAGSAPRRRGPSRRQRARGRPASPGGC